MPELQFDYSSWFIALCVLTGAGYAYLLYSKKFTWSRSTNSLLSVARFLVVSFILFLLLNPLLKQLVNHIEKPILVLAIDNSLSVTNSVDSLGRASILNELEAFKEEAVSNGFEVEMKGLDQNLASLDDVRFEEKTTDLNSMFREVETLYDGKNLAGVVLVSDGNYNRGISPAYFPYGYKIMTVGIGDTTIQEDLLLKNVLYNKIAYQGNKFPIVAEIANDGYQNESAKVYVQKGGKNLASENISFNSDNGLTRVEFNIEAQQNGMQHYRVFVDLPGEEITENNSKDIFIDIIDGKQKILLLGLAPHPDIKALRAVVESNENYEFHTFIPGMNELDEEKYDLVIVHQTADRYGRLSNYIGQFKEKKTPMLHLIGQQSNVQKLSQEDEAFNFKSIRNQRDQVAPVLNDEFLKFKIKREFNDVFSQFPTVNVPYGDLQLGPNVEVLLYQKVGSITTDKPLLYLTQANETKAAYLLSDGIWQWRLQEYAFNENTEAFDEVFLKLVQYLSTREDKRKFRVFTANDEFYDNEPVVFETEIYNDSYERVYGNNVSLKLTDDKGRVTEYSFIASSANTGFEISGLEQGIYRFEATTERNGTLEKVSGRFNVNTLQLELLDQRANFDLLRQVSRNTGGAFYPIENLDNLSSSLSQLDTKGVMHSNEDFFAIINLKWLFFLLIALLSIEWFTRKYSGGY